MFFHGLNKNTLPGVHLSKKVFILIINYIWSLRGDFGIEYSVLIRFDSLSVNGGLQINRSGVSMLVAN